MTFDPEEFGRQGPVIRDKRRIDPETGELREPQSAAAPGSPAGAGHPTGGAHRGSPAPGSAAKAGAGAPTDAGAPADAGAAALAERTADLQRLQAEYLNYKRRVERERENARVAGVANTLTSLLPVLDDIGRAREHGELTGGFKAVAESFERTLETLGLQAFGEVGDPFDPRVHEAMIHSYSADVDGPVCQAVLQVGYQLGDRLLRPARVAVAEPPYDADVVDEPVAGAAGAEGAGGAAGTEGGDGAASAAAADGAASAAAAEGASESSYGDSPDATAPEGEDH